MSDHDAVVRLYAEQIIEQADAAGRGDPVSVSATSVIDKAIMHFRTLDDGLRSAVLLRQLAGLLRDAAEVPGRAGRSGDVLHIACDYAMQAAQALPD